MLKTFSRFLSTTASAAYVAGPELQDAITAIDKFSRQGATSTIGYWDSGEEAPKAVADTYLAALAAIEQTGSNSYLSIKAPALGLSSSLVKEVVLCGHEAGIGIHFDSLGLDAVDRTFELIGEAAQSFSRVGCTLPGRWHRSTADVETIVDLGIRVRVVKGQWADPDDPNIDLRSGYLATIDKLAGRATHVAVATHDPLLAAESLRRLQAAGTSCELELLFGLPMNAVRKVAAQAGVKVRVYIPYGESYLPYALSQVRKKPQILWWVMRDALIAK
jgi:proline dehydrogenase